MDDNKTIPAKYAEHLPAGSTSEDYEGSTFRVVSGCVSVKGDSYLADADVLYYRGVGITRNDESGTSDRYIVGSWSSGHGTETLRDAKAYVDRKMVFDRRIEL